MGLANSSGRGPRAVRILLAEASPPLRWWLRAALTGLSSRIAMAEDGVDLLYRLAQGGRYELVVASASLPGLTGGQVLAMARAAGLGTPFVLLSAFGDRRSRALIERTRPAALVEDALDTHALLAAARELLRSARRTRERPMWQRSVPLLARLRAAKL